jgi:hypothetical protein
MEWKETDSARQVKEELDEDYYEDEEAYSPWKRGKLGRFNLGFLREIEIPLLWVGAGLFFLVLLFVILVSVFGNGEDGGRIASMESRLKQLEERLYQLEGIDEKLSEIVGLGNELEIFKGRFERLEASLALRLDHMDNKIEAVKNRAAAPSQRSTPVKSSEPPAKRAKVRYHQVKSGDTLYSISRRYGLTVKELLRLNQLSPGAVIHPGQKLVVSSAGN